MATINSKIEGVDVLGVVTAGETIYVGRATSAQHGIVKPAATDFLFDSQTNALLVKLGVGLKRTADGIAIAIYDGSVVTDILVVEGGLEIKYADIDEGTENSKVIPCAIKATGGATIDADTLNGLLSGSNGIAIAKNAAGDKVEAKLAIPETRPISLTNNNVPRPAISIEVANGGPPAYGGIQLSNVSDSNNGVRLGPRQILATNGISGLTFDANGITSRYHGNEVGHGLISGGPDGNVKTINGESIYGSGNIDAVPYMTDTYTIPTTDTPIAELIPAGYNKYELELFADTITKFKVFLDGHEAFSSAIYLKLVQTGASLNAFFVAETGNGIHTNNIGGQIKDRITIQGIDSGSSVVYICKKLN